MKTVENSNNICAIVYVPSTLSEWETNVIDNISDFDCHLIFCCKSTDTEERIFLEKHTGDIIWGKYRNACSAWKSALNFFAKNLAQYKKIILLSFENIYFKLNFSSVWEIDENAIGLIENVNCGSTLIKDVSTIVLSDLICKSAYFKQYLLSDSENRVIELVQGFEEAGYNVVDITSSFGGTIKKTVITNKNDIAVDDKTLYLSDYLRIDYGFNSESVAKELIHIKSQKCINSLFNTIFPIDLNERIYNPNQYALLALITQQDTSKEMIKFVEKHFNQIESKIVNLYDGEIEEDGNPIEWKIIDYMLSFSRKTVVIITNKILNYEEQCDRIIGALLDASCSKQYFGYCIWNDFSVMDVENIRTGREENVFELKSSAISVLKNTEILEEIDNNTVHSFKICELYKSKGMLTYIAVSELVYKNYLVSLENCVSKLMDIFSSRIVKVDLLDFDVQLAKFIAEYEQLKVKDFPQIVEVPLPVNIGVKGAIKLWVKKQMHRKNNKISVDNVE